MLQFPVRFFPRAGPKIKTTSISKRLEEAKEQKEEMMEEMELEKDFKTRQQEVMSDPDFGYGKSKEYDSKHDDFFNVSNLTMGADRVPEEILKRMKKIFSKHTVQEVRDWSKLLMKNYQILHAIEKPMNLDYVKPFSNTSDLINKSPNIHEDLAKKKQEEENLKQQMDNKKKQGEEEQQTVEMEQSEEGGFEAKKQKKSRSEEKEESEGQLFSLEYKREHAIGYLMRKMPYHYFVFRRLINEVKERLPNFKPESVLDYGAGLGSGVWATQHIYGKQNAIDKNGSVVRSAAVEPNVNMRKLGKYITEELNEKAENSILWVDSLSMIPGSGGERGKFDLIIVGYVLQEVPSAKQRLMIVEALWQRLRDDGVFILVEPGSPKGFRYIHSFRDWILAKERIEASIIAPCPNHKQCPMAQHPDQWCHFSQMTQRIPGYTFPKAPKEAQMINEKYSYLVVKKGTTPSTVSENSTEDDFKSPAEKSFFWPRLVRPIIKQHKHTIIDMCNTEGKIERRIIAKSHGLEGGYKKAKKMKWGDLWYFEKRVPNKFRKEGKFGKRLW